MPVDLEVRIAYRQMCLNAIAAMQAHRDAENPHGKCTKIFHDEFVRALRKLVGPTRYRRQQIRPEIDTLAAIIGRMRPLLIEAVLTKGE